MAKVGRWDEAAHRLLSFESHWQQMPVLALIEGIINSGHAVAERVSGEGA